MHAEVMDFLRETFTAQPARYGVLEIGARNINGSARDVIAATCALCDGLGMVHYAAGELATCWHNYHGVDIVGGPGVDEVADGATVAPPFAVDTVICCEVFEHTDQWPRIVQNAFNILLLGGRLVVTMATDRRAPHSGVDGGALREDEYYANITREQLECTAKSIGFVPKRTERYVERGDLYAVFTKPDAAA